MEQSDLGPYCLQQASKVHKQISEQIDNCGDDSLTICMLDNFACFFVICKILSRISDSSECQRNSLDPDQARHTVCRHQKSLQELTLKASTTNARRSGVVGKVWDDVLLLVCNLHGLWDSFLVALT